MPISIRYLNDSAQECVIRPAPLVSISENAIRNSNSQLGKTYKITLSGYIIADLGSPYAKDTRSDDTFGFPPGGGPNPAPGFGPYNSFDPARSHNFQLDPPIDNRPPRQSISYESAVDAILFKQKAIRALFSRDGQRMEISAIHTDEPTVICFPRYVSSSFTEGIYVDICQYTIELEADALFNKNLEMDIDSMPLIPIGRDGDDVIYNSGNFIESFSHNWSLESDDNVGESPNLVKTYRITRNLSATGKDFYHPTDLEYKRDDPDIADNLPIKLLAWEQARDFVHSILKEETKVGVGPVYGKLSDNYPNVMGQIGSGLVNLVDSYNGYSHSRTESISIDAGSYSITENWLLASGVSHENYNMQISASTDDPFISVSINGEIKGLSSVTPSGEIYGGDDPNTTKSAFYNALDKYYEVSNTGKYGVISDIYKRANNAVSVELNAQPQSLSVSLNEYVGDITYSLQFNNRPTNILSGVLTENINISDTYPGDVFATIPIIGRETGPILQDIGGRTEYKRDLNIDFIVDYTDIPYGSGRSSLLLQKPSLVEPIRSQLIELVRELSPEKEPGIRKWFISPPVESWEPKIGKYSLNASWIYELNS